MKITIHRAEPILRKRVVETLSTRFKSAVELAELHVWIDGGIHAEGRGLKIFGPTDPNLWEPGIQPLIAIDDFKFQTALRNIFVQPMRVDKVFVRGFTMNIPPPKQRQEMANIRRRSGTVSIGVNKFVFSDAQIVINGTNPDKPPMQFDISGLQLTSSGPGQPLRFETTLMNPKPIGEIHSTGLFGPFNERSPRDTAVSGAYRFTDADLGTIRGIGGILSSEGQYSGTLARIKVDGETDTPDFRLARSGHLLPLHTDFHAIVDATDGDTYLEPVRARLRHSSFTAKGKVVRIKGAHARDIELDVVIDRAKVEDFLALGVKTDPPLISGNLGMRCHFGLPPGDADIADRLRLSGTFHIPDGSFESAKLQKRIDDLSLRSRGQMKLIGTSAEESVTSEMQGSFKLEDGVLAFSWLHFQIPGTHADMTGRYTLDGRVFDFHGRLKMEAKLSQMTRGWKSILLKPVDPFFRKDGAGTEVPFKIDGTNNEPHFGLDFHHKDGAGTNQLSLRR